jgi:hypothetical protein
MRNGARVDLRLNSIPLLNGESFAIHILTR